VYLPFTSVWVPVLVVPFTFTVTPGSGKPSSLAVTLPVTARVCANSCETASSKTHELKSKIFLIEQLFSFWLNEFEAVNLQSFSLKSSKFM